MNVTLLNVDGTIEAVDKGDTAAVLSTLAGQVELAPGYSLRSFFTMLDLYGCLAHLSPFFTDLLDQFHRGAEEGCRVEGIQWLVLEKTVEMIGFPGEPRMEIYRSFSGFRDGKTVSIREYQVELLLDMEIRLGKLKHVVFGDQMDLFEFDTVFTLFEFIEGIGWELGFHGTPKECQL